MRALARSEGARFIVYGGLPNNPTDWATPPGQVEALVAASWGQLDEIDADLAEEIDVPPPEKM
jgi:hypothetical protein